MRGHTTIIPMLTHMDCGRYAAARAGWVLATATGLTLTSSTASRPPAPSAPAPQPLDNAAGREGTWPTHRAAGLMRQMCPGQRQWWEPS